MATQSAKQVLRREIKKRLKAMTEAEKQRQSEIVTQKLLKHPVYQQSNRISVFLSMHDEVKTNSILKDIFKSNKQCFIPRYIGPKMDMVRLYSMEDYDSLPETSWKIKQPLEDDNREDALETGGLDLILMPGLGFSKKGDRLGRGKGYYDTYLQKCIDICKRKPSTIALAYTQQICDEVPTSELDVPIDEILYEGMGN